MSERSLSEKKLHEDEEEEEKKLHEDEEEAEDEEDEYEYQIKNLRDDIHTARHDQYLSRLSNELRSASMISRRRINSNDGFFTRLFDFSQDCCFHPNNK